MKLTDKRFWIFEAFTILYAMVLMFLALIILDKSLTIEVVLIIVGLSCTTGALTWLIADGKHWFAFGLIYELIFSLSIFAFLMIDGLISGLLDCIGFEMCIAFVFPIAVVCFMPSMILAYVGYNLFNNNITNKE